MPRGGWRSRHRSRRHSRRPTSRRRGCHPQSGQRSTPCRSTPCRLSPCRSPCRSRSRSRSSVSTRRSVAQLRATVACLGLLAAGPAAAGDRWWQGCVPDVILAEAEAPDGRRRARPHHPADEPWFLGLRSRCGQGEDDGKRRRPLRGAAVPSRSRARRHRCSAPSRVFRPTRISRLAAGASSLAESPERPAGPHRLGFGQHPGRIDEARKRAGSPVHASGVRMIPCGARYVSPSVDRTPRPVKGSGDTVKTVACLRVSTPQQDVQPAPLPQALDEPADAGACQLSGVSEAPRLGRSGRRTRSVASRQQSAALLLEAAQVTGHGDPRATDRPRDAPEAEALGPKLDHARDGLG